MLHEWLSGIERLAVAKLATKRAISREQWDLAWVPPASTRMRLPSIRKVHGRWCGGMRAMIGKRRGVRAEVRAVQGRVQSELMV